jgi:hypothetical protein
MRGRPGWPNRQVELAIGGQHGGVFNGESFGSRRIRNARQKNKKRSWNVFDNKALLFLESSQSWNVYENKKVIEKSWNVTDK